MHASSIQRFIRRATPRALAAVAIVGALGVAQRAGAVSTGLVISQVYGGGGNTGATWRNDYIEIHNRGNVAVDVTGWSVQYASAAGTTWLVTALSGSVAPGGYYLVQQAAGAGGTVDLPTPDATGSTAMSATSAKVALVSDATALSGTCPAGGSIVDLVGYGSPSCSEGSATGALNNTTAALRNADGCEETDDNAADFTNGAPTPRNSSTAARSCHYTVAVTVDPVDGGTVTFSPDQATYLHGTSVELTATPALGRHFVTWSGDATGTANPTSITLLADASVTAHFEANPPAGAVVISQVYGGGGNIGSTYRNDFIELFNRGPSTVDVTGWSVQYSAADASAWTTTTLLGTLPPGRHFLIQEAQGAGGTQDLPTPDIIHDIPMHSESGKVALVNNSIPLSGTCPSDASIVDMVGYGSANCAETGPTAQLSNPEAALRGENGCTDSGDNAADFAIGDPDPRNTAAPFYICSFWVGVIGEDSGFALDAVVPTPVRRGARVHFSLAQATWARLEVLDLQGRVVEVIAEGAFAAGRHDRVWDLGARGQRDAAIYFVRLVLPGQSFVRKVSVFP
jgi:hypothetical protein